MRKNRVKNIPFDGRRRRRHNFHNSRDADDFMNHFSRTQHC